MQDHQTRPDDPEFDFGGFMQATARVMATAFGIVLMIVGAYFAISLIATLLAALNEPEGARGQVDAWTGIIGPKVLEVKSELVDVNGSRVLAIAVLGGLVVATGWLSIALVMAGAKVVQLTTTDREAIQRVLREALGKKK